MSSLGPNVRTADLNLIAASCAAPPTVYVLSGGIDYDSDDVLGAYSSC